MDSLVRQDKKKIIEYALTNIPFDGWTMKMLHAAFKHANISPDLIELYFPGGLYDLLIEIINDFSTRMTDIIDREALSQMRTRDRIAYLVKARISIASKHKEVIKTGISIFLCTRKITNTGHILWSTADSIWIISGDKSLDFSYYTKRGILSIIYAQTLLFWLEDKSDNHFLTWRYLDEKIDRAIKMGGFKTKLNSIIEKVQIKNIPIARYVYALNAELN